MGKVETITLKADIKSSFNFTDEAKLNSLEKKFDSIAQSSKTGISAVESSLNKLTSEISKFVEYFAKSGEQAGKKFSSGMAAGMNNEQIINKLNKNLSSVFSKVDVSGQEKYSKAFNSIKDDIAKLDEQIATLNDSAIKKKVQSITNAINDLNNLTSTEKNYGTLDQRFQSYTTKIQAEVETLRSNFKSLQSEAAKLGQVNLSQQFSDWVTTIDNMDKALQSGVVSTKAYKDVIQEARDALQLGKTQVKISDDVSLQDYTTKVQAEVQSIRADFETLKSEASKLGQTDLAKQFSDWAVAIDNMDKALQSGVVSTEAYKDVIQEAKDALKLGNVQIDNATDKSIQEYTTEVQTALQKLKNDLTEYKEEASSLGQTKLASTISDSVNAVEELDSAVKGGSASTVDYQSKIEELTIATKKYKEEVRGAENLTLLKDDPAKFTTASKQIQSLESEIQKMLDTWTKAQGTESYSALEELYQRLQDLKTEMGEMSFDNVRAELDKIGAAATENGAKIRQAGDDVQSFGSKISSAISGYLKMFTGTMAVMKVVQGIKQMVSATTELDSAMAQLRIVSQRSSSELESYFSNITDIATETASSVTDVVDAMTTYSRLGFDLDASATLANLTTQLQNVGDIDASSAQNAITAIIKAFDIDTNKMESVMDKMVVVGNNFPISVSQLAEGMNNAAAILANSTGQSFDKAAALLTAANVTTQNISKSSTALRTIVARLRKMDTELNELGEVMTTADYDALTRAITEQNVSLVDEQTGELRDAYDVLQDLSVAWQNMGANARQALAQTFGSTRNQNIFVSLMENFGEAEKAMKAMENSQGELQKANSEYLKTIKSHVEQLKVVFDTLIYSQETVNLVNNVVDIGKALLEVVSAITKIVDKIGGLRTVLAVVVPLILRMFSSNIVNFGKNFADSIKNIGTFFKNLRGQTQSYILAQNAANASMTSGAVAASALSTALSSISIVLGVVSAVVGAIQAISSAVNNANELKNIDVMSNADIKESSDNIKNLYEQYDTLAKKSSLTSDEQKTLTDVTNELNEALGLESPAIDSATESLQEYTEALSDAVDTNYNLLIADAAKNLNAANQALVDTAHATIDNYSYGDVPGISNLKAIFTFLDDESSTLYNLLGEAGFILNDISTKDHNSYQLVFDNIDASDPESLLEYISRLEEARDSLLETDVGSELYTSIEAELDKWITAYELRIESIETISSLVASKAYVQTLRDGIDISDIEAFRTAMINNAVSIADANANVSLSYEQITESVDKTLESSAEAVKAYESANKELKDSFADLVKDESDDGFSKRIESYTKGISTLRTALDNLKAGKLESDDLVDLALTYPSLAPYINDTEELEKRILELIEVSGTDMDEFLDGIIENTPDAKDEVNALRKALLDLADISTTPEEFQALVNILDGFSPASKRATEALNTLKNALNQGSYGDGLDARGDNFLKMLEKYNEGEIGDSDFRAYAEYFGIDLIDSIDENGKKIYKTYEQIGKEIEAVGRYAGAYWDSSSSKWVTDADLGMKRWLEDISAMDSELVQFDQETKTLTFDPELLFNSDKLQEVASQLGITSEFFIDLLNNFRKFSLDIGDYTNEELQAALETAGLFDGRILDVDAIEETLKSLGYSYDVIEEIVERARQLSDTDIELGISEKGMEDPVQALAEVYDKIHQMQREGFSNEEQVQNIVKTIENLDPEIQADVIAHLKEDPYNGDLGEQVEEALGETEISVKTTEEIMADSATTIAESTDTNTEAIDNNTEAIQELTAALGGTRENKDALLDAYVQDISSTIDSESQKKEQLSQRRVTTTGGVHEFNVISEWVSDIVENLDSQLTEALEPLSEKIFNAIFSNTTLSENGTSFDQWLKSVIGMSEDGSIDLGETFSNVANDIFSDIFSHTTLAENGVTFNDWLRSVIGINAETGELDWGDTLSNIADSIFNEIFSHTVLSEGGTTFNEWLKSVIGINADTGQIDFGGTLDNVANAIFNAIFSQTTLSKDGTTFNDWLKKVISVDENTGQIDLGDTLSNVAEAIWSAIFPEEPPKGQTFSEWLRNTMGLDENGNLNLGDMLSNAANNIWDALFPESSQSISEWISGIVSQLQEAISNFFTNDEFTPTIPEGQQGNEIVTGYQPPQYDESNPETWGGQVPVPDTTAYSDAIKEATKSGISEGVAEAEIADISPKASNPSPVIEAEAEITDISVDTNNIEDDSSVITDGIENITEEAENAESALKALGDAYNEIINGNVDYNKRPHVSPQTMRESGYPEFDGDVATTYSMGMDADTAYYPIVFEITPILEDGTVLTPEELDEYITSLDLTGGLSDFLASDAEKENLVLHAVAGLYNAEYWDEFQEKLAEIKEAYENLYYDLYGYEWEEVLPDDATDIEPIEVSAEVTEVTVPEYTDEPAIETEAVVTDVTVSESNDTPTVEVEGEITDVSPKPNNPAPVIESTGEITEIKINQQAMSDVAEGFVLKPVDSSEYAESVEEISDALSDIESTSIDETANASQIEILGDSASDASGNVNDVATGLQNLSSQTVELSGQSNSIASVGDAANSTSESIQGVVDAESVLQGTSLNTSGQVSQLDNVSNAASQAADQFDRATRAIQNYNATPVAAKNVSVPEANAKGTRSAKGGLTLLGDEYAQDGSARPELVVSGSHAYIAGINGPTFANLKKGDVVYPYKETKKILANNTFNGSLKDTIPAFNQESGSGGGSGTVRSSSIADVWDKNTGLKSNASAYTVTYNDYSTNYDVDVEAEDVADELDEVNDTLTKFSEAMSNFYSALKESNSATGLSADTIAELQKRYQDLEGYDAYALFERTANGIHLNATELRKLESQYESLAKSGVKSQLKALRTEYDRLTKEIEDYEKVAGSAADIDLYTQREQIKSQIYDVEMLASQYDGLTSAFEKWSQAQSIGEEGDLFDSVTGGLEDMIDLYEEGLIGTNKFRAAVQLMTNMDVSNWTPAQLVAQFEESMPKMIEYFANGVDGAEKFLRDVEAINSEWAHIEDGEWKVSFDDEAVANAIGINVESVQAILRKLSDYGFDVHLDYTSDTSEVDEMISEGAETQGEVVWSNITDEVDLFEQTEHKGVGVIYWYNDKESLDSAKEEGSDAGASVSGVTVDTSLKSEGNAYAGGSNGISGKGTALAGELGEEILVLKVLPFGAIQR